jgi:hypothetical protein
MNAAAEPRQCGACTACCFTHAVTAIGKRSREWCPHCEIGVGCSIYLDRPEQCRGFSCLWLRGGWGDEQDRPDRLKVVVGGIAVNVGGRRVKLVQLIETEAGAIDQERVARLIERFKANGFAICTARLLPTGQHADATYEIPGDMLGAHQLDAFKAALARLDVSLG